MLPSADLRIFRSSVLSAFSTPSASFPPNIKPSAHLSVRGVIEGVVPDGSLDAEPPLVVSHARAHKLIVPSYLCTPVAVDKDNYQKELVDSNYYKAADLGL